MVSTYRFSWLSIGVALNAGIVAITCMWQLTAADASDPTPTIQTATSPAATAPPAADEHSTAPMKATLQPADPITPPGSQAATEPEPLAADLVDPPQISYGTPPDPLPKVPSLPEFSPIQDKPELDEPLLQEIEKIFQQDTRFLNPPPVATASDQAYFDRLDLRLKTVQKLTSCAQVLAAEAASHSRASRQQPEQELLHMSEQLRKMAAQLLLDEL